MALRRFFENIFGKKKDTCETTECSPEVCNVPTEKIEVPVTEEPKKEARIKADKKEVTIISEKLAEVATDKVVKPRVKKDKKEVTVVESTIVEKKSKPRRRRKPKPKNDEGQL